MAAQMLGGLGQVIGKDQGGTLVAFAAIGRSRQNRQGLVENSGQGIADSESASGQTDDLVELPVRLMDLGREGFDRLVVVVPGDKQVSHSGYAASFDNRIWDRSLG